MTENRTVATGVDEPAVREPRPRNTADERMMLWGLLFFFGLGLYAAAFVTLGVWLGP